MSSAVPVGVVAASSAASAMHAVAGAVRVTVARDVFAALLERATGPVVRVRGLLGPTWWLIHGGFAFHTSGGGLEVPSHLEVIDAKHAW